MNFVVGAAANSDAGRACTLLQGWWLAADRGLITKKRVGTVNTNSISRV